MNPSAHSRTRAIRLLEKIIATRWFDHVALAEALVISPATLDAYLANREPMPLNRQLALALFVIERVPPLARAAHQLRGQVTAAITYEARETANESPPPSRLHWR